jgi:Uma2 family endonuclease
MTYTPYRLLQRDPSWPPKHALPTMYDLPSEDPEDPGLPDVFHLWQPRLLDDTCIPPNTPPDRVFTATDLNLYYDPQHLRWYKRPDWFMVLGVPRFYEDVDLRASYVIWQEEVSPLVVVELLSPGTEDEDLGENELEDNAPGNGVSSSTKPPSKWQVYEQILQVPHYIIFSRYTNQMRYFRLEEGVYQEQSLDLVNPRIWIPEAELGLGIWHGEYEGLTRPWLRWYDADGNWIPTNGERVQQERVEKEQALEEKEQALEEKEQALEEKEQALERAEQERLAKEQASEQLRQIVLNLLRSGLTPEQVANLTGLSLEQVQQMGDGRL